MTKAGIDHPEVIDLVSHDPKKERWELILVEDGSWDGSTETLSKLQDKLNNYLKFALDGAMQEQYPDSKGKQIVIRLDLYQPPDQRTLQFIDKVRRRAEEEGLELALDVDLPGELNH